MTDTIGVHDTTIHTIETDENGVPLLQNVDGAVPEGLTFTSDPHDDPDIAALNAQIAFLQAIKPLVTELEAARATQFTEPARFFNASQRHEAARTYIRKCAEYIKATSVEVPSETTAPSADVIVPFGTTPRGA